MDSPLLEKENQAWSGLLRLCEELQREVARLPKREVTEEGKLQLGFLEARKYDKLKPNLIEKCKLAGFCFCDDITVFLGDLFQLATVFSESVIIEGILDSLIRISYAEGKEF